MTIPQRLREIAVRLRKPRDGRPWGADDGAADLLSDIAAELEAPAACGTPDPHCRICHGTGVDGDCKPDGSVADVDCFCVFKAPATDAAQVVAWVDPRTLEVIQRRGEEGSTDSMMQDSYGRFTEPLIRQRDHLATAAALQARITSLEADLAQNNSAAEFWYSIYADGISQEELRAELSDYKFLLEQVPKVYDAVTGGRLTKTNYFATVVISEFEDYLTKRCEEEVEDSTEELQERINALEARQVVIFEAVGKIGSARSFLNGYILSNGCRQNNMEGIVRDWIDGLSTLYRIEDDCRELQQDTSKEQP